MIDSFDSATLEVLKKEDYQWVCLGDDAFKDSPNSLICKNQKLNIEEYKSLLTFTGFYALVENNLLGDGLYRILEYDFNFMNFDANLEIEELKSYDVLAYMNHQNCFYDCFSENFVLKDFMREKGIADINVNVWFSFGFLTTRAEIIKSFYHWIKDFVIENKHRRAISHVIERIFYLYCVTHGVKFLQKNGVMMHHNKRIHGIS